MKAEYSFSELIEEVSERNLNLEYGLDDIVGVTIEKGLIPTVANLTQTNLEKFYIVKPDSFVYNPRTHGVRLGMGYNDTNKVFITSWNNLAFKVREDAKDKVLSQYLWIYFNRLEWDRQTNFMAWGSSTIVFAWNDFLRIKIKLPDIAVQQKIVDTYNAITRRIGLLQRINEKLERTAQTIYKKMFVEDADENWETKKLGDIIKCYDNKRIPLAEDERANIKGNIPYYGAMSIVDYINQYIFDGDYILFSEDGINVIDEQGHPALQFLHGKFWLNNHAHILQGNEIISNELLYLQLKNTNVRHLVTGAAQPKINQKNMNSIELIIADKKASIKVNKIIKPLFSYISTNEKEITKLHSLKQLVISRISGM